MRTRFYSPSTGRFIQEDSYWGDDTDPLSLNYYLYCDADPVNRVDPYGDDSYILYDTNGISGDGKHTFKDEADIRAKQLGDQYGTKVWVIGVADAKAFQDKWNNQVGFGADGNHVNIDEVVIILHGSIGDSTVKGENGVGYMYFTNGHSKIAASGNLKGFNSKNDVVVSGLDSKSMGSLYFSSCNTGNPDVSNVADAFNYRMSVSNKITAWDGGTIYNYKTQQLEPGAYGGWYKEKSRQATYYKYVKKNWFIVPGRKRQGQVNVTPIIHNYYTTPFA